MPEGTGADTLWWPFALMVAGALATYVWRALGVALSGRIDPNGEVFEWIACVAYALLAGLIARMILLPTGPLAETTGLDRVAAAGLAFAVFFLTRRNMLLGVGSGVGLLAASSWARGAGLL